MGPAEVVHLLVKPTYSEAAVEGIQLVVAGVPAHHSTPASAEDLAGHALEYDERESLERQHALAGCSRGTCGCLVPLGSDHGVYLLTGAHRGGADNHCTHSAVPHSDAYVPLQHHLHTEAHDHNHSVVGSYLCVHGASHP